MSSIAVNVKLKIFFFRVEFNAKLKMSFNRSHVILRGDGPEDIFFHFQFYPLQNSEKYHAVSLSNSKSHIRPRESFNFFGDSTR